MALPHGFREWLAKESERWRDNGLLLPDQRERILALYPETEANSGRLAFALRAFGVLLLGAAVLLVISHNWSDLSRAGRLATVLVGLLGLQGVGLWYSLRSHAAGSVLGHLAGCIMFGAAITLTGQIYHLDAHSPDAVLAWCLGTLPFALLLDSALLHIGTVILAGTWLTMETGNGLFGHRDLHLEAYRLAFYALILPTAVAAYRNPRPILASGVAWACAFAWLQFRGKLPVELFVLPLAIAALHRPGDPRARGWRFIGALGVMILTITFGNISRIPRDSFEMGTVMTVAVVLMAVVAIWRSIRRQDSARNWPAWIALVTLALGFIYSFAGMFTASSWILAISIAIANATTIALSIWLLRLGLAEGRLRPYVYGALVFLSWLMIRYVDIGREMSMLTLAGFFAVIGAILFALARVWRSQKETAEPETMEAFAPGWLQAWADQVRPYRLRWLVAAVFVQVGVIGWMVYHHHQPLRDGARFRVRCQPIDPRDLLKGDYVILSYDFSRFTQKDIRRLNAEWERLHPGEQNAEDYPSLQDAEGRREYRLLAPQDTPVYVPLNMNARGVAEAGEATLLQPTSGAHLRGLIGNGRWNSDSARFGIEAFYVTEGAGREWEKARNQGQLLAEIAVLPDGRAGLVNIRKVEEADRKRVSFQQLENLTVATRGQFSGQPIRDKIAFANLVRAKTPGSPAPIPPDFSREMLLVYTGYESLHTEDLSIESVEQVNRTLVITVRSVTGQEQAESTRAQVILSVPASNPRTIEFRDVRGSLLQRIEP